MTNAEPTPKHPSHSSSGWSASHHPAKTTVVQSNAESRLDLPAPTTLPDYLSLDALPPIRRWTQWGGVAIATSVALTTALTAVTPYRVTIPADATIRPMGELKQIEAATAGTVVEVLVEENQPVHAGSIIARIDDSQLQTRKNQLQANIEHTQLQLQQIEAQLHNLNRRIQAEDIRAQRLINVTQAELRQVRRRYIDQQTIAVTEVDEIEAQLRAEQVGLEAAQLQVNRYQPLTEVGAMSQEQLDEAELAVRQQEQTIVATQARLQRAQTGLNPSDADVAMAQAQIAQEQASSESTLAALSQEQAGLIQQALTLQQQQIQDRHAHKQVDRDLSQTVVRAPATGTIFQLNLRNVGQSVSLGEPIAQMAPHEVGLTIRALISTTDIHQVKVGQTAQLRISACPYPDYGILSGMVQAISPDTVSVNSMNGTGNTVSTNPSNQTGYFEVGIQPTALTFGQGKHQCDLRSGMTANTEIVAHEETVLTFLLRKAKLLVDF